MIENVIGTPTHHFDLVIISIQESDLNNYKYGRSHRAIRNIWIEGSWKKGSAWVNSRTINSNIQENCGLKNTEAKRLQRISTNMYDKTHKRLSLMVNLITSRKNERHQI